MVPVDEKKILIIIEDSAILRQIAGEIAAVIGGCPGYAVKTVHAEDFSGIDLLPCCAFFLGCEMPHPPSFSNVATMLDHINLAGRRCGIFSSNGKSLKYLSSLVHDCEVALGDSLSAKDGVPDSGAMLSWVKGIIGIL